MADDLDFTEYFSDDYTVVEPTPSPQAVRSLDELGTIGEAKLKSHGFYTRIISAAPAGRARAPGETLVLIVEDDALTGDLIETVLRTMGYPTRRARDRAEIARGLAAKPMPDLVLLDVELPDVNGFDVLNRIRQHAALKDIPVVMLTAASDHKDIGRGLMLGANGYITKPALPSTLIDAVQAIVAG
jgi:CheY-like chemotaxis protein